uniref:uncharacterized protein n=1 Tax=Myxine glutinosa TaxID=7769 RepID=UPI00358E8671
MNTQGQIGRYNAPAMMSQGFLNIFFCLVIVRCGDTTELTVWQDRAYGRPWTMSSSIVDEHVKNASKNRCSWTTLEESAQITVDLGEDLPVYNVAIEPEHYVPLEICLKRPSGEKTSSSCKIEYVLEGESLHLEFHDFEATLLEVNVLQRARFSLCSVKIISPDGAVKGKPSQNHLSEHSDPKTTVDNDENSCSSSYTNNNTFWKFEFEIVRAVTSVDLKFGDRLMIAQMLEVSTIVSNGSDSRCSRTPMRRGTFFWWDCGGKRGRFLQVQRTEKGHLQVCNIHVSTIPTRESTTGVFGWSFQARDFGAGFEAWQALVPGHGSCNTGCSLSGIDRTESVWWKVILAKSYQIVAVRLTGRSDLQGLNLFGSSIYVQSSTDVPFPPTSLQLCSSRLVLPPGESRWFRCPIKTYGNVVMILKPKEFNSFFSLCEVSLRVNM